MIADWISGLIQQEDLPWTIVPQIALSTLNSTLDSNRAERGDFLLVHPQGKEVLVEVDGEHHLAHGARDEERDRAMAEAGIRVVRVPAQEARDLLGPHIVELRSLLLEGGLDRVPESELSKTLRVYKFVHQIQIALVVALQGGWLSFETPWNIGISLPNLFREFHSSESLVHNAVRDLWVLLSRLACLYGRRLPSLSPQVTVLEPCIENSQFHIIVGPANESVDQLSVGPAGRFVIADTTLPFDVQAPLTPTVPARLEAPNREELRWFLNYLFRKEDFWEGQWETIERSLRGEDSVVLLPTGGGKSIAFQLAALLLPGRCIVVDPILSLIDDQMDNLMRVGIDRCIGITSDLSTDQRESALRVFRSGHYFFCYVAPERFQTVPFRNALRALTTNTVVSLIVVDEAHCVSEWGHDFRTAYLNLGRVAREYGASQDFTPPLVALTGTASKIVLKDVQRELEIVAFEAIITPKTFDRPELSYKVLSCHSSEKTARLEGYLRALPADFQLVPGTFFGLNGPETYAGLVFCPHVNGSHGVIELQRALRGFLPTRIEAYSGTAPRGLTQDAWRTHKKRCAQDFKHNLISALVCTKAFGMGIDKPNIRYTVHISLQYSLELHPIRQGDEAPFLHPLSAALVPLAI